MAVSYDGNFPPSSQASYLGFSWLLYPELNSSATTPSGYVYPTNTSFDTVAEAWFMNFSSPGDSLGDPMVLNDLSVTALVKDADLFKRWLQQKEGMCGGSTNTSTFTLSQDGGFDASTSSFVIKSTKPISPSICRYTNTSAQGQITAVDANRIRVQRPAGVVSTFSVSCTVAGETKSISLNPDSGGAINDFMLTGSIGESVVNLTSGGSFTLLANTDQTLTCKATTSSGSELPVSVRPSNDVATVQYVRGTAQVIAAGQSDETLKVVCRTSTGASAQMEMPVRGQGGTVQATTFSVQKTVGVAGKTDLSVRFSPSAADAAMGGSTRFVVAAETKLGGWNVAPRMLLLGETGQWSALPTQLTPQGLASVRTATFGQAVDAYVSIGELSEAEMVGMGLKIWGGLVKSNGSLVVFPGPALDCSGSSCVANSVTAP